MFGKQEFNMFRQDVEQALQEVGQRYGIEIKAGHITYGETKFTLKLEAHKPEVNGKSFEQAEFEKYCLLYGLSKEDYNKQFVLEGKVFTIFGFKPKASKYPILARCENGKTYKFSASSIRRHIAA